MTQMMISGMSNITLPMTPLTSIRGRKAAMVVSDEETTGASMRLAPPSAAWRGCSPAW